MKAATRVRVGARAALLGLGVLVSGLSACSRESDARSGEALWEVFYVQDGALTVCSDIPYAPFEFTENGRYSGFDVELVEELATYLDVELDIVDVTFDDIVTAKVLNENVCDMAISAIAITGQRARFLDFSSPYFDAHQHLISKKDSGPTTLEELGDKRVGVKVESTGRNYVLDFAPRSTEVVTYDDLAGVTRALLGGEVDAIVVDSPISATLMDDNPDLRVAAAFATGEQYGMVVAKDLNVPLLLTINDALFDMRESGKYNQIYDKYF